MLLRAPLVGCKAYCQALSQLRRGRQPGTFYHTHDVKGRHKVDIIVHGIHESPLYSSELMIAACVHIASYDMFTTTARYADYAPLVVDFQCHST